MNRKRSTLTGLALLCTAAVMTTGAIAGETRESIDVNYVAAELTRPEGAESLYHRIEHAARRVCHEPSGREVGEMHAYRQCFDRAVDAAVAQVNSSALTAVHRSRTRNTAG
jgi:UrcA family protein